MLDIIPILLNLLRPVLLTSMWFILDKVPCALEMNVYSAVLGWNVLWISNKSYWSNVSCKTTVSLLIFCLDDLSIDVSGILKSPTIIVLLSISPFMSVNICFVFLGGPVLDAYILMSAILFFYWSLYHFIMPFFVSSHRLSFKLYFVWYESCYPSFLVASICITYLFPAPYLYSVSLVLKWVSCKQHIDGSCFFIQSATLWFLIEAFSPLTFTVIIDGHVLIAILLLVSWLFCRSSLFFSSSFIFFPVVWWFSLVVCLCSFLSSFCVSIVGFWFVATWSSYILSYIYSC